VAVHLVGVHRSRPVWSMLTINGRNFECENNCTVSLKINFNYLFLCMLNVIICIAVATEISLDVGKHSSSRDIIILWRTN